MATKKKTVVSSAPSRYAGKTINTLSDGSKVRVTSDSSGTRSDRNATNRDIGQYESKLNTSSLTRTADAERRTLEAERQALDARRDAELAGIETDYAGIKAGTEADQEKEYAGRSTSLITSGGGFLGGTQSQQGVLQNLRETQRTELEGLQSKKDAAIRQARNAYDDKDFALARELVQSAKDTEKEIYNRQNDYADKQIQLSRYNQQDKQPIQALAAKYISAGINPDTDDFETASQKVKLSEEYLMDKARGEADLRNTNSLISSRNGSGGLGGSIGPDDLKNLRLPNSLLGYSNEQYRKDINNSMPPAWFVEYKGGSGNQSIVSIYQDWNKFRNTVVTPVSSGDFNWGGANLPGAIQ